MTTGNFGGFDVWLDETPDATIELSCNHGQLNTRLDGLGLDGVVLDAGGLDRKLRVFRLPEQLQSRQVHQRIKVPLQAVDDNPLWICVTTEDGFQAWSSPIFVFC